MKRNALVLVSLLSTALGDDVAPSVLRWKNGETIPGELVAASASELTWRSPLFAEPLRVNMQALRRIDSPRAPLSVNDSFGIALRDGGFVHGDLVSLSEKNVTIRSARHGEVVFPRASVLSMRRLRGGDLVYGGPMGDAGWRFGAGKKAVGDSRDSSFGAARIGAMLKTGAGGALSIPFWNAAAVLDVTLPDSMDVEFRVRSTARPDFLLSLNGETRQQLRVETWDDDLVLAQGNQFKLIRKLNEEDREVGLRLCWNRKARTCSVFSPGGQPLAEWKIPEDPGSATPGLVLQNKGRDVSLELLRVRKWDGKPPAKFDLNTTRIEMADGRIVLGRIGESGAAIIHFHPRGADNFTELPLDKVDALIFSTDTPTLSDQEATLSFADGTLLSGRLVSIKDGRASMRLPLHEAPVTAQIHGLRSLRIALPAPPDAAPEPVLDQFDKIVMQAADKNPESAITLHGRLAGAGDAQPRWLPVGGVQAVALGREFNGEITRVQPEGAGLMSAPALLYTASGEVLPGDLRAIGKTDVEFDSGVVEATSFPADSVNAIQFGSVVQKSLCGFSDSQWRITKGDEKKVRRTDKSVSLDRETAFAHPSALQSSEIRFNISGTENYSGVRLRMFCPGTSADKSSSLVVSRWPGGVMAGFENQEEEMDNRSQFNVPSGEPVAVRVRIDEQAVELSVNGNVLRSYPLPLAKRMGGGLIIEPASMFGNEIGAVTVSEFSTQALPGRAWLPDVAAEAKAQTLTVPRFRKDDPPRHALIGMNGDVLRGEIEAVTQSHYGFRSGLENLRVPRDRVNAVIWLKKPMEGDPPPVPVESSAIKMLDRTLQRRVQYGSAGLSSLIGALRREAADLKFTLPEKDNGRRAQMKFEGQTIKEALGQICAVFGMHYRLDQDGTIVIEEASLQPAGMEEKSYLLKSDKFPKTGSPEEILRTKGVEIPDGASVSWQAASRQLTMVNTTKNHAKLAAVIEADFGGSLTSPTHWFLLTDGGRIGLTVDRFGEDSITGRHPIFGRCKVALANIHTVRTSAPDSSAAMKSLHDWQLVFAPEPVLPETGGESSAMLGKEAQAFKLPMLGGGEFDLVSEKGKVVVLDFWATWCGPCIKSLPGLIEAMSEFPEGRVRFVGVNQSEPTDMVKRFLETRGWKFSVAMDVRQEVAKQFGVDGIPHTVILGADGKVAWVKTGFSPDGAAEAGAKVRQLLDAPAPKAVQ